MKDSKVASLVRLERFSVTEGFEQGWGYPDGESDS